MYMQTSINSPISCGHDQHWQSQNVLLISACELLEELAGALALRGFVMIDLTDGYILSVPNAAVAISVHLARSPPLRSTHQLLQLLPRRGKLLEIIPKVFMLLVTLAYADSRKSLRMQCDCTCNGVELLDASRHNC